jgi:hypothetical protein
MAMAGGLSSDVAWALSWCLEWKFALNSKAGRILSSFGDDCIPIRVLHMAVPGVLRKGFGDVLISRALKNADRENWLIAYEAVRQRFSNASSADVTGNSFCSDLFNQKGQLLSHEVAIVCQRCASGRRARLGNPQVDGPVHRAGYDLGPKANRCPSQAELRLISGG